MFRFAMMEMFRTMTEIFSSDGLRGWKNYLGTVLMNDPDCVIIEAHRLECWIDKGETINVSVTVKSPYDAEFKDTFDFTISAQPEEIGVIGRTNQQFDVTGDVESSLFGFAEESTVAVVGGGFICLILLGFIISRRS